MKIAICTAAVAAAICFSASSASAQYPTVVPHQGHYHVIPSSPYVSGYGGYQTYSPGISFGIGYASPGVSFGGTYNSPYYGGSSYYVPRPMYSGYGNYGGQYQHHHHGHR